MFGQLPPSPDKNTREVGVPFFAQGADVRVFDGGRGPAGVSVIDSDGRRAYIPYTTRYSRLVAHNAYDPDHPCA